MGRSKPRTRVSTSDAAATVQSVDEGHFGEIDAAMLFIEEARRRTERAAASLREEGAEEHLVDALEQSERRLSEVARDLRQGTFFAVPAPQLTL